MTSGLCQICLLREQLDHTCVNMTHTWAIPARHRQCTASRVPVDLSRWALWLLPSCPQGLLRLEPSCPLGSCHCHRLHKCSPSFNHAACAGAPMASSLGICKVTQLPYLCTPEILPEVSCVSMHCVSQLLPLQSHIRPQPAPSAPAHALTVPANSQQCPCRIPFGWPSKVQKAGA